MQVASSQMAGNQVRVVQLPQRLKKGKARATEKAINGELLREPLARKAWWLKVMFFEYHKPKASCGAPTPAVSTPST